jgi:hypothetical protein
MVVLLCVWVHIKLKLTRSCSSSVPVEVVGRSTERCCAVMFGHVKQHFIVRQSSLLVVPYGCSTTVASNTAELLIPYYHDYVTSANIAATAAAYNNNNNNNNNRAARSGTKQASSSQPRRRRWASCTTSGRRSLREQLAERATRRTTELATAAKKSTAEKEGVGLDPAEGASAMPTAPLPTVLMLGTMQGSAMSCETADRSKRCVSRQRTSGCAACPVLRGLPLSRRARPATTRSRLTRGRSTSEGAPAAGSSFELSSAVGLLLVLQLLVLIVVGVVVVLLEIVVCSAAATAATVLQLCSVFLE